MKSTMNQPLTKDRAKVFLFPPLVGLTLALFGIGMHLLVPYDLFSSVQVVFISGLVVFSAGIVLQVVCIRLLKKAKTTPLFVKPTKQVLQHGPYAISRNPIYVAVLLQFIGLILIINTWWLFLSMIILIIYLQIGVIAREEKYLQNKFGAEYTRYKSRVPRWIL